MPTAAETFAAHVTTTRYQDIPAHAIEQAKIFILDTLGVGISGSTAYGSDKLLQATQNWGAGTHATLWGRKDRTTPASAAFLNAFQVHCQEYDCVCEPAVLHPMATLLPAALAFAESTPAPLTGKDLLVAVAVGCDISCGLGVAATTGLKFFRPATAGGFGAAGAVARLAGLDTETTTNVLGIQYAQTSGTMQAHVEASTVLPMQVAFNSRAAIQSVDIARTGLSAPKGSIDGQFGYLPMMETAYDLPPILESLGHVWRIGTLSHKPFPAGRATHGALEAIQTLAPDPDEIASIIVRVPPLTARLIARPDIPDPLPNYARLCTAYVVAKVLQYGTLDLSHLRGDHLTDPATHRLAQLVEVQPNDNPDPNALAPQTVTVTLKNGQTLDWSCDVMLANPARPLTRDQHLAKFRRCWTFAADPLPDASRETLIDMIDHLEDLTDLRRLLRLLAPA